MNMMNVASNIIIMCIKHGQISYLFNALKFKVFKNFNLNYQLGVVQK